MNNSNDTIGNPTRDLPALSAVPQPTALSYTLYFFYVGTLKIRNVGYWPRTENTGNTLHRRISYCQTIQTAPVPVEEGESL
jgi:hypothetical protein